MKHAKEHEDKHDKKKMKLSMHDAKKKGMHAVKKHHKKAK